MPPLTVGFRLELPPCPWTVEGGTAGLPRLCGALGGSRFGEGRVRHGADLPFISPRAAGSMACWRASSLPRDPAAPVCGPRPTGSRHLGSQVAEGPWCVVCALGAAVGSRPRPWLGEGLPRRLSLLREPSVQRGPALMHTRCHSRDPGQTLRPRRYRGGEWAQETWQGWGPPGELWAGPRCAHWAQGGCTLGHGALQRAEVCEEGPV